MRHDFRSFAETHIIQIDGYIKEFFQNKIKTAALPFMQDMYADLLEYATRDGKRIRPLNMLIAYLGYKKWNSKVRNIEQLASVLELMHCFLLVQDDIIDNSILRRGQKALHVVAQEKYGRDSNKKNLGIDVAIVLADVLFTSSVEIIAHAKISSKVKDRFLNLFASTYEMTAWGQVLDSINSMSKKIDLIGDTPMHICKMKTAYYTIYKPLLMGYILTGRDSDKEKQAIEDFSMSLGLAFQLRDDILGVFGHENTIGKSSDSDIHEAKTTLLIRNTVQMLNNKDKKEFVSHFMTANKTKKHISYIKKMIKESGGLEATINRHLELIDESMRKLNNLAIRSDYKEILQGEIDIVSDIVI